MITVLAENFAKIFLIIIQTYLYLALKYYQIIPDLVLDAPFQPAKVFFKL
jgi:hypothetical protein